jgi:hypothetical protein
VRTEENMPSLDQDIDSGAVTGRLRAMASDLPLHQVPAVLQLAASRDGD